jgi:hypothetical protein
MPQWEAIAHRGELGLTLLTPQRARADGWLLRPGCSLIGFIEPDGEEPLSIGFRDLARLAGFIEEMRPHDWRVVGVEGEDVEQLRCAIIELRRAAGQLH